MMMTQTWFIPGTPVAPAPPLARYRPAQPVRAVGSYVGSFTRPGDLVVDLFCQGPTVVRETVALGRRVLGLSVNPLLLAAARMGLGRRNPAALNAAFTHLADSPKGDVPLRHYLDSLYRSTCPACGISGVAEWFAWDRDGNYPFRKAVRCPRCEGVQEGAPDDEDLRAAGAVQPRGLSYYYALDRVAPPGHPARKRATELVELYTPRNLSALMSLILRLEGLEADEEVRTALTGALIDCFDAGSSLNPYGEERTRPRTLRVPSRYRERNVWLCFGKALSRLLAGASLPLAAAADPAALARGEVDGYALIDRAAGDAGEVIPPESAALIFADPPRPDGVFWALSALWAGWLWDSPAARALRPFLRRRRFDWEWHWDALRNAVAAAGPLLTAEGRLVTLFSDHDESLLESVCLAASGAGYVLDEWGCSPEIGYRLVWRWEPEIAKSGLKMADGKLQIATTDVEALGWELAAVAEEAAVTALEGRGEPVAGALLHAGACAELTEKGLMARTVTIRGIGGAPLVLSFVADAIGRGLEAVPVTQVADREGVGGLWWLTDPGPDVEPPLADQIENAVWALLARQPVWGLWELIEVVYALFPGHLTPDLALVRACVDSYSVCEGEMRHLRPEDEPERRAAELVSLRADLAELGGRLGFSVRRGDGWDVRWLEEGQEAYAFAVSATANLVPHLLARSASGEGEGMAAGAGAQFCLVLPGGRARLVDLKLQRDPRLARAVEVDRWQFIKFRHLRRLAAEEELDRHALKTVLGLDPIAEQEAAQIPLF